ncbi:MAG: metallophosphoesterase [Lachnospiraceae bacterium]|nr:metallophosphoesterase [Lachnospiraceae bacterium]
MKILIVSDTHRKNDLYVQLCAKYAPLDMVIHCGDIEGSEYIINEAARCPVKMVSGNNDFFSDLKSDEEFTIGKYKIWVTHGHHYYVSMGNEILKDEARSRGIDIVMYGHTHKPLIERESDLIALNPGSLTYPRQEGRQPSYIIMTIGEDGQIDLELNYI